MSYTYIAKIMSNKSLVDSTTSQDLKKAVTWADKNSIEGDLIVISEGYAGADDTIDEVDHVMSYYVS